MMTNITSEGHGRDHVVELDGLRGILALWVAVSHILLWCGFAELPIHGALGRAIQSAVYSTSAVDTFYILSGFAITYLLCTRRPTYAGFMLGRFFRIYPVYLLCLLVALAAASLTPFVLRTATWRGTSYFEAVGAISASEQTSTVLHLITHLSLFHGMFPRQLLPESAATFLAPAWSISVEWQYYLCAMIVVWLARSAIGMLTLTGVSLVAIHIGRSWYNPLPAFFPLALPLFLVGAGSYHLFSAFRARGARRASHYSVVVAAAAGGAVLVGWHATAMIIWAISFGCLFVDGRGPSAKTLGWLRRLLARSWSQWLGRISFPLYLVHWPLVIAFLAVLLHYEPRATSGEAVAWLLLACLPLALAAAYLLHSFVEAPFMRLGKRLTSRSARPGHRATHESPTLPVGSVGSPSP